MICHCRTKFAVTVFEASHGIECACAPASLQLLNRYWLVGVTVCGLGASRAAFPPASHQNRYGAVWGAAFTVTVRPAGADATVI